MIVDKIEIKVQGTLQYEQEHFYTYLSFMPIDFFLFVMCHEIVGTSVLSKASYIYYIIQ